MTREPCPSYPKHFRDLPAAPPRPPPSLTYFPGSFLPPPSQTLASVYLQVSEQSGGGVPEAARSVSRREGWGAQGPVSSVL